MAVIAIVAALFCQGTLEFWILLAGATGVVKFLDGKSRATYVWTTIIQEPKVVELKVCGSDIVDIVSTFQRCTLMASPELLMYGQP